ncbi:hypothetical protein KJ652_05645 [Patescibacteria group bacterium]|nr:hypothetical protein [Patescibacteria group bacterium]MBU1124045.1 hypothetical protein [Patescibacteria group bacterium]MBU1911256.1 hypothetical protein [Patescibacteria group bacterium]
MTETLLLALFLRYFTIDSTPPPPTPTYRELRKTEGAGALSVEVVPVTGGTIPPGASRVKMLDINMTASCSGEVSIKSIKLVRRGPGDYRDISRVYIVADNRRISPAMPMSRRDGSIMLRVNSFSIPRCETKTITVLVDFSGTASVVGEHRFVLPGATSIVAAASSINVRQIRDTIRQEENRTVAGEQYGEISVTYLPLTTRITYGHRRTFLRFSLKADGLDDHRINAITLTNRGTANKLDLQSLYLPGSNVAASLEGDKVRLEFKPPISLKKNQSRLMILRGDVRASRRRTIDFIIEEPGDIESEVVRGRVR